MHIVICGFGYTGAALAQAATTLGRVTVITRQAALPGFEQAAFDDPGAIFATATHLVATAAPDAQGDPVLARHGSAIATAPCLRWAGYLSTTGIYGDRGGAWVDETTPPAPSNERGLRRLAAEQAWTAIRPDLPIDLLRLAGIYGPGRSVLDDVRSGRARRVDKPGHLFGRIHRDDITGALLAAMVQTRAPGPRVLNGCDDEPAAGADVIAEAARLLDRPLPPLVPFADAMAAMSPMGRSFWADNRKVRSAITQQALGRPWLYPSYREGLRAVLLAEQG